MASRKSAKSADRVSAHRSAAILAAQELTARIGEDAEITRRIAHIFNDAFNTYVDTANARLHNGLRITRLEMAMEYGINLQDPATAIERNEGVLTNATELANGVLYIGVSGAPPRALNVTLSYGQQKDSEGIIISMLVGNREMDEKGEHVADPYIFILPQEGEKRTSPIVLDKVEGLRHSRSAIDEEGIPFMQFIAEHIRELIVLKRTPQLVAKEAPAA